MGIRYLNTYMKNKCKNGIKTMQLKQLSGCSLAVDISIYMYRYEMEDKLIENTITLITTLLSYDINPIFVFDGKPPEEKIQTLNIRKERRKEASEQCKELLEKIKTGDADCNDICNYEKYKQDATRITREKVNTIKKIIDGFNLTQYTANGEADELCAFLVLNGYCWGCMSDDMDMFVYGCNNIIRDVDIYTKTAVVYSLPMILYELNITYNNFKQVCILSGTDYNNDASISDERKNMLNIHVVFKLYYRFTKKVKYDNMLFYDWLKHYIKYDVDYDELQKICDMFVLKDVVLPCELVKQTIKPQSFNNQNRFNMVTA
jgi:flap endonuclease-1